LADRRRVAVDLVDDGGVAAWIVDVVLEQTGDT
jgi:hypothetical protein